MSFLWLIFVRRRGREGGRDLVPTKKGKSRSERSLEMLLARRKKEAPESALGKCRGGLHQKKRAKESPSRKAGVFFYSQSKERENLKGES